MSSHDEQPSAPVPTLDLDSRIAAAEAELTALRAQKAAASVQQYPKALYKAGATLEEVKANALTCLDETAATEAAADGYVYENPGTAVTRA